MSLCTIHPIPYRSDPCESFERIRQAPGAILLDSGRPQALRGRYDLLSAWPRQQLRTTPGEPASAYFQRLRLALATLGPAELPPGFHSPFAGGLIGLLAYDFGKRLEHLPASALDDLHLPDGQMGLYDWALVNDHQEQASALVFHPAIDSDECQRIIRLFEDSPQALPGQDDFHLRAPFQADLPKDDYRQAIQRIQDYIRAGDCYQVNFTQRFRAPCQGDPWQAYRALRQACPTPYAGFVSLTSGAILSASPERFLRLSQGQVETRPIKGTRPRNPEPQADAAAARELLESRKDQAENLMIVDLLRNDLGRSCEIGSIRVPELFALESYPNVHHLVSSVVGQLRDGLDALDLLAGSFPGGSITGAPKIRAMQIIDELEPTCRSIYCGSLLYLDVRGEMDSSIAIRTLLVEDGQASCWGGGAITLDSEWQAEYQESVDKVKVLMETLEGL
ncbi:aminodeoxychorismate synthase component I [Pseudomonas sp. ABC1]|uniref:aminodeoxychorismate synthase component I n=1 Tax=Pseudomonas sp. ABC1 TaxID=2748080 RepID=UPI0015C3F5B6|nr:aminodeoxychorismate synthase component I [Pseudomonas sp. ABC1]QLF94766.1 aminodeoxychorismate synthase component I [Pseudomonas sp. ABC1]